MKKYLFFLLAAIAFVACSNDNEEMTDVIRPSKAPADVKAFFQSEINNTTGSSENILPDVEWIHPETQETIRIPGQDTCSLVNSLAELAAIYVGEKQLPNIDFTQYTLVVGKETMPETPYYLKGMTLKEEDNVLRLTLKVEEAELRLCSSYQMRYWALFPKLSNKPIVVDVIGRPAKNNSEQTLYSIVNVSTQVREFFSDIESAMRSGKKLFDFTYRKNEHSIINSQEKLAALYKGEKQLPDIDFSKYTLLVGHVLTSHSGYLLDRIELTKKENWCTLNVYIHELDEGLAVITPILYWGLYPKFPQLPINVVPLTADGEPMPIYDLG